MKEKVLLVKPELVAVTVVELFSPTSTSSQEELDIVMSTFETGNTAGKVIVALFVVMYELVDESVMAGEEDIPRPKDGKLLAANSESKLNGWTVLPLIFCDGFSHVPLGAKSLGWK